MQGARARSGAGRASCSAMRTAASPRRSRARDWSPIASARGFSSWYEMFPALRRPGTGAARHLPRRRGAPALHGRHGLRRAVLAAHPPDRARQPQGRQQRARGAARATSAVPGRSARPRAATRTSCRELGTLEDFRRLLRAGARARHRDRARPRLSVRARPSLRARASANGSSTAPTAACSTRRIRPRSTRTSIPFDFETEDWRALWEELKSVVEFWIEQGVRIFRVDNPHTKPFAFWEWLIGEVQRDAPGRDLPRRGVHAARRSCTAWRSSASRSRTPTSPGATPSRSSPSTSPSWRTGRGASTSGPNVWPNTPDILHETLQSGLRAAFAARLVLAATLSANYGIYGPAFELHGERAARARQRGVPRLGEVPAAPLGPRPPRQPAAR